MANASKLAAAFLLCAVAATPQVGTNSYTQLNLVSDVTGMADTVDPNLINPWGLTRTNSQYGGAWYVCDNGSGFLTPVDGYSGYQGYTVITVPSATGEGTGSPAGACFLGPNNTFTTLDGTIQQLSGSLPVTNILVNNSARGAIYTACTEWTSQGLEPSSTGPVHNTYVDVLYVANSAGGLEAYNSVGFDPVPLQPGAFTDPHIPAGFTPYGLFTTGNETPHGNIFVAFSNGTSGPGQGYVDAFGPEGTLLFRLQHGSFMNQPSGITQASDFGYFSNDILVAMTGSGMIAAFNPNTGQFEGFLEDSSGQDIVISGLHGIGFGSGSFTAGPDTTLYFTAGIDGFMHGLFGTITAN